MINKEKIDIYLKRFIDYICNVQEILKKPEMMILPGQISFFIILSMVPLITLIAYLSLYFGFSAEVFINVIRNNFGSNIANIIMPIMTGKSFDLNVLIIFIVMFYITSNGAHSIIIASNEMYNIEHAGFIKRRVKAFVLTILILLLIIFVMLVPAFGKLILKGFNFFNIKHTLLKAYKLMQGPVSYIVIFIFIKFIYYIAPDKQVSNVNRGSLFTTVGWILSTHIYSYYINGFSSYELFYAGLSNFAVLMIWIYFLSYIFVIGMGLNYQSDNNK